MFLFVFNELNYNICVRIFTEKTDNEQGSFGTFVSRPNKIIKTADTIIEGDVLIAKCAYLAPLNRHVDIDFFMERVNTNI